MTDRDLIVLAYDGDISIHQYHAINNLKQQELEYDFFTAARIDDALACAQIEALVEDGKLAEANEYLFEQVYREEQEKIDSFEIDDVPWEDDEE